MWNRPILRHLTFAASALFAGVTALSGHQAAAATLTWTANTEPDLAGYRIYMCTQQPCTRSAGTAALFSTLGTVTSLNIGTPSVVQYYLITAYDASGNESRESGVVTYTPAAAPPPASPPPSQPVPPTVTLSVLGLPNNGDPWSVLATTNATGSVAMEVWINGTLDHTESATPFCSFGDTNGICTRAQKPAGVYNVEFRVLLSGNEVARQSLLVTAAGGGVTPTAPPPAPANLRLGLVQ